eukprot:GHVH01004347.1.p1 GENE.GHVH01004347.1~~GHVH01004347.1.p1  ORF type:complete len:686 (+),score=73.77 GHVH01004347.1:71-2128(+)
MHSWKHASLIPYGYHDPKIVLEDGNSTTITQLDPPDAKTSSIIETINGISNKLNSFPQLWHLSDMTRSKINEDNYMILDCLELNRWMSEIHRALISLIDAVEGKSAESDAVTPDVKVDSQDCSDHESSVVLRPLTPLSSNEVIDDIDKNEVIDGIVKNGRYISKVPVKRPNHQTIRKSIDAIFGAVQGLKSATTTPTDRDTPQNKSKSSSPAQQLQCAKMPLIASKTISSWQILFDSKPQCIDSLLVDSSEDSTSETPRDSRMTEDRRRGGIDHVIHCSLCSRGVMKHDMPLHLQDCTRKISFQHTPLLLTTLKNSPPLRKCRTYSVPQCSSVWPPKREGPRWLGREGSSTSSTHDLVRPQLPQLPRSPPQVRCLSEVRTPRGSQEPFREAFDRRRQSAMRDREPPSGPTWVEGACGPPTESDPVSRTTQTDYSFSPRESDLQSDSNQTPSTPHDDVHFLHPPLFPSERLAGRVASLQDWGHGGSDLDGYPTILPSHRGISFMSSFDVWLSSKGGVSDRINSNALYTIQTKIGGEIHTAKRTKEDFIQLHRTLQKRADALSSQDQLFFNHLKWTPLNCIPPANSLRGSFSITILPADTTSENDPPDNNEEGGGGIGRTISRLFRHSKSSVLSPRLTQRRLSGILTPEDNKWSDNTVELYIKTLCIQPSFRVMDVMQGFLNLHVMV